MQLPSVRTLKHYIDANLEEVGDCIECLEDERKHYLAMVEKRLRLTRSCTSKVCVN